MIVGLVALLALLLTACEINVNYDLLLRSDGSSELQTEVVYDQAASEMLGPPEAFLNELEDDTEGQIDGVTVLSSSADSSDPDEQRVSVTLEAEDAAALDALVSDNFFGSFSAQDDDVYELYLQADDANMDDEMGFDMAFIGGAMVIRHDGERESFSGGEEVDSQTVNWDPFGPEDLRMVVDLGAGGSAGGADVGIGILVLVLLGLLVLAVIGVVVFLLVRKGRDGGGEPGAAAPPMAGPSAGEVDAMQTPPAGDPAQWTNPPGAQPPQPMPQPDPESWDQPPPASDPAPQAPPPGTWAPPTPPAPPEGDDQGGEPPRQDPPPPTP